MSNEELVTKIQEGKNSLIEELWIQVVDYISFMADKTLDNFSPEYRSLKEDMVNESYFYFLTAINNYTASAGCTFLTYLSYHLKTPFRCVLLGGRTKRKEKDLLNESDSLNRVVLDSSGNEVEIGELQASEQAEALFNELEDADYWNSVHEYLEDNLSRCDSAEGREIFQYMLDNDCTFADAIRKLYGSDVYSDSHKRLHYANEKNKARRDFLKNWRKDKSKREKIGLDDFAFRGGYRVYNFSSFKRHGSFVEYAAIKHLEANDIL